MNLRVSAAGRGTIPLFVKTAMFPLFLMFLCAAACAETLEGTVYKTSAASVDLVVYDAQGRAYPNALHLKTDYRTRFSGISSPSALRLRDPLRAEVSRMKDGSWRADSLTKLTGYVRPANAPASNALADALKSPAGQNVIRGGLSGAVTGGIASYASGGKAGKGALLGAGLGAVAGLLQGLFNQPAPVQQPYPSAPTYVSRDDRSG